MKKPTRVLWLTLVPVLAWLLVPDAAQAHEGKGFHPEALWNLLQTGFLVGVGVSALIGALWVYERWKSREAK